MHFQELNKLFYYLFILCFLLLWFCIHYNNQVQNQWLSALENEKVIVLGKIVSIPENSEKNIGFLFLTEKIEYQKQNWAQKKYIKLYWRNAPENQKFAIGQTWQLLVNVKKPHGYQNPGSFNQRLWAIANHISGNGYIVDSVFNRMLSPASKIDLFSNWRQKINDQINKSLNTNEQKGFIKALIIGVRDDITREQWQVFNNTGTNHLVAIAGLHIGFLSDFAFRFISFIWRLIPKAPLFLPTSYLASFFAVNCALIYSGLSGFLIPTQRASAMMLLYSSYFLFYRQPNPWRIYLQAVLILYLLDPLIILTESFWLSFASIFFIIYGFYQRNISGHIQQWLRLQLILGIGIIPLTILYFGKLSLVAWLANMVAVPVVGFSVIPLVFLASICSLFPFNIFCQGMLFQTAAGICHVISLYLTYLSNMPYAVWEISVHSIWPILTSVLGLILLFSPWRFPFKSIGMVGFLPLFFVSVPKPDAHEFWLTVLDVGQGLSSVIQTQNHALIFDAGPQFGHFNAGQDIVIPFLKWAGIKKVDQLVISHSDWDHRGGAYAILKDVPVAHLYASSLKSLGFFHHANFCEQGQSWQWDGVDFMFIYPLANYKLNKNNMSCVLKVCSQKNCALLPGDIEAEAEKLLVQTQADALKAKIIIVPHHGSSTSSTLPFLSFIQPDFAVFAVGYFNRYEFPKQEILNRYHQLGANTLRTDELGSIRLIINSKEVRQF